MKNKLLLGLLFLLVCAVALVSGCSEVKIVNITAFHDINQGETPFEIELSLGDIKITQPLSLLSNTDIANVPIGTYNLKITRYGATETKTVNIDKNTTSIDLRLFGNMETEESGEVYYTINDANQFFNLNALSGSTETYTVKLACNIDFLGYSSFVTDFSGILDGKRGSVSYTLNNFSLASSDLGAGLFMKNHGSISNIVLSSVNVSGKDRVGALVSENYGTIEMCSVMGGTVSGVSYVGGMCGIDYGMITACTSTSKVSGISYYGKVIGASLGNIQRGTFSELVGYSIKPSVAGKNAISEEQTPSQMLLTAMNNWSALDNRTKLVRTGLSINPLKFLKSIATTFTDNLPDNYKTPYYLTNSSIPNEDKVIITAMYMLKGMKEMHASVFADLRLVYDGAESEGLNKLFAYADAFVSDTSFDALLKLFGDFSGLYDPFSAAFYLDNEEDYLMGSIGEEASFVNPDETTLNKRVIADFDTDVFWGNILVDFNRYCADDLTKDTIFADTEFSNMVKEYIDIAKEYLLYADLASWDEILKNSGLTTNRTKSGDTYTVNITVDGAELYKTFIDFINERLNIDVDGPFSGLQIEFIFNKPVTIKAEIWDNGNMKSLVVDDVDFTIRADIPLEAQNWLRNIVLKNFTYLEGFDLTEIEFTVTNSTPLIQMYSYSESDTDIELQKNVFTKDEDKYINFVDHTFNWMRRRLEQEQ